MPSTTSREGLIKIAADAFAEDSGWDDPEDREQATETATVIIDALIEAGVLNPDPE